VPKGNASWIISLGTTEEYVRHDRGGFGSFLPEDKPRIFNGRWYTHKYLLRKYALVLICFDCVMPTRNMQETDVYLQLTAPILIYKKKNGKWFSPPFEWNGITLCRYRISKAYLKRHLFCSQWIFRKTNCHNTQLRFFTFLTREARKHFLAGIFMIGKNKNG